MNRFSQLRLILMLFFGFMTSQAKARVYVHITGEEGVIDYNMERILATISPAQGKDTERALGRGLQVSSFRQW